MKASVYENIRDCADHIGDIIDWIKSESTLKHEDAFETRLVP